MQSFNGEIIILRRRASSGGERWREKRFTVDPNHKSEITDEGLIIPTKESGDRFAEHGFVYRMHKALEKPGIANRRTTRVFSIN